MQFWKDPVKVSSLDFMAILYSKESLRTCKNYVNSGEWIKKMWDTHMHTQTQWKTIQLQNEQTWTLANNRAEIENVVLSKINQKEKDKYWMVKPVLPEK